ncbi:MAG TPA: hypothetical protein VG651_02165 [Stellaceae bacterium]|nr:hypothetical protein [Stellaceae bacterium]
MAATALRRLLAVTVPPLLVGATLLFFGYPPLKEEADGECSALTLRVVDEASHDDAGFLTVSRLYGSSSSEPSGAAYAQDRHPLLPAAAGCALEYWRLAFSPPPTIPPPNGAPAPAPAPASAIPAEPGPEPPASVIARGITPNGDPISPATVFSLPMNSVAIRVGYHGQSGAALRFQLTQGRTVLATCPAERAEPGIAWCKFNVELHKGFYTIALTAGRELISRFPFTVIGR